MLARLLPFRDPLRFTEYRYTHGEAYYAQACRLGWEGIIGKRADARPRGPEPGLAEVQVRGRW